MSVNKVSNEVDSRYFLIKVIGDINNQADKDEIFNWILSCLSTVDDPAIYTNFDDQYSWQVLPHNCECEGSVNYVYVAIYMRWRRKHQFDTAGLTIEINEIPEENLPIVKLYNSLVDYPEIVTDVGISGISRTLLKKEWWRLLDGSNGYLWYNSYYRALTGEWNSQVDISNQYRWDDESYPFAG